MSLRDGPPGEQVFGRGVEVLRAVAAHDRASRDRLHLVPSENRLAVAARIPHLTEASVRYAFASPDGGENWAWPGNTNLTSIERDAEGTIAAQIDAKYVNLKAVSGVSAMTVALSALARPGDTVWNIAEADGGHGSTRFIGARLGLTMRSLPFDRGRYAIDIDLLADLLQGAPPPALVYLDAFMCLFPHDVTALRNVLPPQTLIHYDASHTLGLIAGGRFQNPLGEGSDSLGGSTHKTYPGPHKGILATNRPELAVRLDEHASHFVSHHHPADVVALALAAAEMDVRGRAYADRTISNARHLGDALVDHGFAVCAGQRGHTASHQLWIDIAPVLEPALASHLLYDAGIVVNAVPVPYLTSGDGLRLGVQEASWIGMGREAMDTIAGVFAIVLRDGQDPAASALQIRELLDAYRNPDGESLLHHALTMAGVTE